MEFENKQRHKDAIYIGIIVFVFLCAVFIPITWSYREISPEKYKTLKAIYKDSEYGEIIIQSSINSGIITNSDYHIIMEKFNNRVKKINQEEDRKRLLRRFEE